ncbi:MAG: excisionase family DNA binding protein [Verrucomicrobiales bacterium]|jgi:excisionase family DNA binding protein
MRKHLETPSMGLATMKEDYPARPERFLRKNEAAERMAISVRNLDRLISAGEFPAPVKINRSSRILESDVEAYMARLKAQRDR